MHQSMKSQPIDYISIVFHALGGSIFTAVVTRQEAEQYVQMFADNNKQKRAERVLGRCLANNIVFAVNLDEVAIVHQSLVPPEELRKLQAAPSSPYARSGS